MIRLFYYYARVDSVFSILSPFIPTSSGVISVIKNGYVYKYGKDKKFL